MQGEALCYRPCAFQAIYTVVTLIMARHVVCLVHVSTAPDQEFAHVELALVRRVVEGGPAVLQNGRPWHVHGFKSQGCN